MEGLFILVLNVLVFSNVYGGLQAQDSSRKFQHTFHTLSSKRTQSVSKCCDVDSLFKNDLPEILKVRVPDTPVHTEVKEYIISRLNQLDQTRWEITLDEFTDTTPFGEKSFTNIIATMEPLKNPNPKRLVLSAHYDSKYDKDNMFVGATDSGVPVAMILDLILTLDSKLKNRKNQAHSIQIIFFDGEEAFKEWTDDDSIYGSRHLAAEMEKPNGPWSVGDTTGIEAINVFMLLDLLGSNDPPPRIHNSYSSGDKAFERLISIEKRLDKAGLLTEHKAYFVDGLFGQIQDDHIPFAQRKVPIIHIIPAPFPRVWHRVSDNMSAIDKNTVQNFKKILMVFLYEYFYLQ